MRIRDILKDVAYTANGDSAGVEVTGLSDDSRAVKPGDLFVAVRGCAQDGHAFVDEASRKGARAIVCTNKCRTPMQVLRITVRDTRKALAVIAGNFYGHPSRAMKTIGVTGTNGKTTVTYLLESIIRAAAGEPGIIGTVNYRYGRTVVPAKNTTPGSRELQAILAAMLRDGVDHAIMEVSSHALHQGRIGRILFDTAIFTNLTSDHLDYHRTRESYFNAKRKLFRHLKKGGAAILNSDDKKVASLARSLKCPVVTYGLGAAADVRAHDIAVSMNGTSFTVRAGKRRFAVRTKLIGLHNVSNILAAIAATRSLGIAEEAIVKGVGRLAAVPGRLEAVEAGQPFKVFVDFAHTEDALNNVLTLLRQVAPKRIVTVFGCGGNRDRTKRPRMGKVACSFSDHVIITSDNPRFEEPAAIAGEIEGGIRGKFSNYDVILDRRQAIARALGLARRNDIVIIAGKGHEGYQIVGGEAMSFDDRQVALGLLKAAT